MRTTLVIDQNLLVRARRLTGIKEKTALVHAGLKSLIAREAGKRLAALGGSEPKLAEDPEATQRFEEVILVDTSVWIDHFRSSNARLNKMLGDEMVLTHPFVIGELVCGSFKNRAAIFDDLGSLPAAVVAEHDEVLRLVEDRRLWGRGIGWIDSHLLASALLSSSYLWTLDRKLNHAAAIVGVRPLRH